MSQTIDKLPLRIRKGAEGDHPFIYNSWLRSFRDSWFAKMINSTTYYTEHHKVIERLLQTCEVFVACNNDDVSDIYGYIVAEFVGPIFVLHFAYTKHTYRCLGIGKLLLNQFNFDPSTACVYTHHNRLAERIGPKFNMVYSPYIALTPDYRQKAEVVDPKFVRERLQINDGDTRLLDEDMKQYNQKFKTGIKR
jgi:hypothetical protein